MVLSTYTVNLPSADTWAELFNILCELKKNHEKKNHVDVSVRVIDPKEGDFAILRYNHGSSASGWLRSVVYQKSTCRPVCVSPPRASELDATSNLGICTVQEFVDGTMMNLFWVNDDAPQVVTRSRLGADNSFYGELSFLDMLNEALSATKMEGGLNDLRPSSDTSKTQFVSIVLQHPKNRVVTEVSSPRITVIHTGCVETDGTVSICENPSLWNEKLSALAPGSLTVSDEAMSSLENLTAFVEKQGVSFGYQWQGIVLKTGDGTRYRLRNKEYVQVKQLRGNESDAVARFCRLRQARLTKRYMKFYPEDERAFYVLEGRLRGSTRRLLDLYVQTFKLKKQEFHTLPWPYKHHVSVLHNRFKEALRPNRQTIELNYVIGYINSLSVEDMVNLFKEPHPRVASVQVAPVTAKY
jgi:hypothetical protein